MLAKGEYGHKYKNFSEFYNEFTSRNQYFISKRVQTELTKVNILVAGCGSTGGACVEALARLGVMRFSLADNGSYELNNLNRQHAYLKNLGENKAIFFGRQILNINPFIEVKTISEGITPFNVRDLVRESNLIIDAVDVTTYSGIQMKILLHEQAKSESKPLMSALDMGYCQWGKTYDYRDSSVLVLDGKVEELREISHPLKALLTIVPISLVPSHCLNLVEDLLTDPSVSASQVGCTSDLLSSLVVALVIRFVDSGVLLKGWKISLESHVFSYRDRIRMNLIGIIKRRQIRRMLSQIS